MQAELKRFLTVGLLATETPLSVCIRRFLADRPAAARELFGDGRGIRPLPFVHVFGRPQFAVSYFGANSYPENIAVGLEQPSVAAWVTGKFVMKSKEDTDHDRYLAIAVELAPGVQGSTEIQRGVAQSIADQLRRLNSEFAHYTPPEHQLPRVSLHPAGDPDLFPPGVKHRYTR